MEIEYGSGTLAFLNRWDIHELDYAHRRVGRIVICEDGRVVRWENSDE